MLEEKETKNKCKKKNEHEKKGGKMMRNFMNDGVKMNKVNIGNGTASVCWIHFACDIAC